MRTKAPALLVAISVSVSACATAGSPFDGIHHSASSTWLGAEVERSVPSAPRTSQNAPLASPTASFATSLDPDPLRGPAPAFGLRGHELDRFRQPPPVQPPPPEPPGVLATVGSSLLLVGLGVLYLGGKFKGGGGGGGSIRWGGSRASLRVSPTSTGFAVKF